MGFRLRSCPILLITQVTDCIGLHPILLPLCVKKNIPSIVLGRNLALVTKSKSGPNNASNARTTKENSNLEVTLN